MIIHEDKDSIAHLYGDCKGEDGVITVRVLSKDDWRDDLIIEYKILDNGAVAVSNAFCYEEICVDGIEEVASNKFHKTIGDKLADLLKTKKQEK